MCIKRGAGAEVSDTETIRLVEFTGSAEYGIDIPKQCSGPCGEIDTIAMLSGVGVGADIAVVVERTTGDAWEA